MDEDEATRPEPPDQTQTPAQTQPPDELPPAADQAAHEAAVTETTMDTDRTPRDDVPDDDAPRDTPSDESRADGTRPDDTRPLGTRPDPSQVHDDEPVPVRPATTPVGPTAGSTTNGAPDPGRRGIRVGTVVWGLVLAAIGVGLLAAASGVSFDVELAVIGLVAAAGLALLIGSIATGARRSR